MASPALHSTAYSSPTNPSLPETPSSQPKKIHIPPPLVPHGDSRFHTPKFQQDRVPSPSTKMSNVLSPANGMKTGSPAPHLSTPPGPPIFTLPIRPAAVPFRASLVTPQPVPFSSGSSLSTSFPPHFSNGSTELHYQATNVTEDTLHTGEAPYVLFYANKVLKQKKLANILSLGFRALISSGREISPRLQIIQRDPHRCTGCGAYANVYCKILLGSGQ